MKKSKIKIKLHYRESNKNNPKRSEISSPVPDKHGARVVWQSVKLCVRWRL